MTAGDLLGGTDFRAARYAGVGARHDSAGTATLLRAVVGIKRERAGRPAGLRTHILVTLDTTVFVAARSGVGMASDGVSQVIPEIATGVGFIAAGSILKLNEARDIQGLTTAAGIWMMAAVGVAVGLGSRGVAVLSTVLTLLILASNDAKT